MDAYITFNFNNLVNMLEFCLSTPLVYIQPDYSKHSYKSFDDSTIQYVYTMVFSYNIDFSWTRYLWSGI